MAAIRATIANAAGARRWTSCCSCSDTIRTGNSRGETMRRITAVAILAATTFHALARDLPTASPESVGMSSERLDRIGTAMRRYVDDGKIAGMVTLVGRHGK